MMSVLYTLTLLSISGEPIDMQQFKGKYLLIVNSASGCGFHYQLKQLDDLEKKYRDKGLAILITPSNDFSQEPLSSKEIACNYLPNSSGLITTELLHIRKQQHPLYKFLTKKHHVWWNYTKFLISPNGNVIKRFFPWQQPNSKRFIQIIEKNLEKL